MKNRTGKLILALVLSLTASFAFAQKPPKKYFIDASGKKIKAKGAKYYRVVTEESPTSFLVKDYFASNDQLQMEGRYKTKKLNREDKFGLFTFYYKNGNKASEGEYTDGGKVHGQWTYWHMNGEKRSEGEYDKGKNEGYWNYWHKNGAAKATGKFINDEKDSIWTFKYDNGDIEESYNFNKGKKDGAFTEYFKGGQINEKGSYVRDSLDGAYELFWESGTLSGKGQYVDNKKDGDWEWYHSNGKLSCTVKYKKGNFIEGAFYNEKGEKEKKKVTKNDLISAAEFPGGIDKMYEFINKELGPKVDVLGMKAAKYSLWNLIQLRIDEQGFIIEREFISPDLDDDFDDEWDVVKNLNYVLDIFPKMEPRIAYNRKVKGYFYVYYFINFGKK